MISAAAGSWQRSHLILSFVRTAPLKAAVLTSSRKMSFLLLLYAPSVPRSENPARYSCSPLVCPPADSLCHHMAGISPFPGDHWRMSPEHLCSSFPPLIRCA